MSELENTRNEYTVNPWPADGQVQLGRSFNGEQMSKQLNSADAIVVNEGDREIAKSNSRWQAIKSFHRAPCLAPSFGIGAAGGFGLGGVRYLSGSGRRAAFTWGSVVAGLLAGTSWYTCRRAMYAQQAEEMEMLQRGDYLKTQTRMEPAFVSAFCLRVRSSLGVQLQRGIRRR